MFTRAWDPFRELETLRREVERAFDHYGNGNRWSASVPGAGVRAWPLVNLHEDKDEIHVEALAPGIDPAKIDITVQGDVLRIAGEKRPITGEIKPEAWHRNERGAGRFLRAVTLPAEVDSGKVKAEYRNGLLRITLPKHEKARPKQIAVKVA
jgi:HSP20 family protein